MQRARHSSARSQPPPYGLRAADSTGGIVQRQSDGNCAAPARAGGPLVSGPGRPLERRTRHLFEGRMGADFSDVRIHDGAGAAAAARGLGARAFTLGSDISFAAGQYRPGEPAGRRLIAHELAHVVQQGAASASHSARAEKATVANPSSAFEAEADRVAAQVVAGSSASPSLKTGPSVQLQVAHRPLRDEGPRLRPPTIEPPLTIPRGSIREHMIVPLPPALPELEFPDSLARPAPGHPSLLPTRPLTLDPRMRFRPVMIIPIPRCIPDRPLTWADFPGSNVPGTASAVTRIVTPLVTVDGNPMFQAQLNQRNRSAVIARVRHAGNRSSNGCAQLVAACRRDMRAHPGGTWTTSRPNPDTCPASQLSINTATTADECETVIGAGCDSDAVQESTRLLAHEQLHFDLACKLVGRADDALIAGSHTPVQLRTWLRQNLQPLENRYDRESVHGCDSAGQSAWAAHVAGGLQFVQLPGTGP